MAINKDNLRVPTSEQAREYGRKGGIASAKKKAETKQFREILEKLLGMKLKKGDLNDIDKFTNIEALKGKNLTTADVIMLNQILKAMKGDTKATEFIRDTIGQKPKDEMDMNLQVPVMFEGEDELI